MGQGFPHEHGPWLLSQENRRKIEPKEIPSCLIPCLLVLFTGQLEILVTALNLKPEKRTCREEPPCMGYYSEYVVHSRALPIIAPN